MFSVLIADDEHIIRMGLRDSFPWAEHGMQVVAVAEDGAEAYDLAKNLHPDIIITDINMPDCDGLEFLSKIKKISNYFPEMIILTGYSDFEYAKSAVELGASAFLLKPVNEELLLEELTKAREKIKRNKSLNQILSDYNSKMPEFQNVFLTNLFKGKIYDTSTLTQQFNQYGIKPHYFFAIANITSLPIDESLLKNNLPLDNFYLCTIHESEHCLLMYFDSVFADYVYNALSALSNTILEITGTELKIGISNFFNTPEYYTIAYYEAYDAVQTLSGTNRKIVFYNSLKSNIKREVQDAVNIIMRDYSKQIAITDVADELHISESHLIHLFKQGTGQTFNNHLTEYRINVAKNMLKSQKYRIYEIADHVGYKSTKYFSTLFKKVTGLSPSEYLDSINK